MLFVHVGAVRHTYTRGFNKLICLSCFARQAVTSANRPHCTPASGSTC